MIEDQKIKPKNQKNINNLLSYKFNFNDIQSQKYNENSKNIFINNYNMNNPENQSRFINYFKMNENSYMTNNSFYNNTNNHSKFNNNFTLNNNIIKKENYNYKYENESNNINLNENYLNYSNKLNNQTNLNFITPKNFGYNKYEYNINNLNNINTINNKNNINNINDYSENYNNTNDKNNFNNKFLINKINIPNTILSRNSDYQEFLNYINNLNKPLIKFLCTKNGILEMETYLNNHKKNNIEILIYLLNKEGLNKLMKHKVGNYFIQEIIKDAKYPQVKLLLELISLNFVEISKSSSGTHVLQALLDKVNTFDLRDIILKSIENKELEMAFNINATYVLRKIISIVPDIERLNANEIIINNCINLAFNSECVFIVEKFISTITINENKIKIQNIITKNCIQLATNPFGNYLIQYLFQVWKDEDIEKINNIIIENANFLIKQKYSSNIIEKAIDLYDNNNKQKLIRSLIFGGDILDIIKNQYGHYVINKVLKYMDERLKFEIETILINQLPNMSKKEKIKSKKFIANMKEICKNKKNLKKNKK